MFSKLRRARADLGSMNALFLSAERIARADGIDQPGAEHLMLAALELDDGIAQAAMKACRVDADDLRAAIDDQHEEALRTIGVIADDNAIAASLPKGEQPRGPYQAQGSLQTAFQNAVALSKRDKAPLNSGYLLLAITDADHGTVARSFEHLGVDRSSLRDHTRKLLARI